MPTRTTLRECPACRTENAEAWRTGDGLVCVECAHIVTQDELEAYWSGVPFAGFRSGGAKKGKGKGE